MKPVLPSGAKVPSTAPVSDAAPLALTTDMNASLLVGLRASQEVSAVFEHASLGIALTRDRVVIRHNRAFAQTLGYPPNRLVGLHAQELFLSPDDYAVFGNWAGPTLAAGKPFRGEHTFRRFDGSLAVCVVSASAVDPLHPEWGTIWIFDDVTAERQQQVALKDAQSRIEAIMTNAPLGIVLTTNSRVADCNAHFEAMFGYEPGQALGVPASEFLPDPEAYAELLRFVGPRLEAAQPVEVELRMRCRNGDGLWVLLVGYVRDVAHPRNGTIWLITDRSEPRRQAQALEQALAENQAIFDHAALGMVVLINRCIVRCNPQMETMFGHPPGTMRGMSTRSWYPDEATFYWVGRHLQQGLSKAGAVTHELPLKRADGSLFWARMTGRLLGDSSTLAGGSLWLLEDITARRQTESELRAVTALNQTVFESANVAIIATDTEGTIQLFNATAQRLLGYRADELIGQHNPGLLHIPQEVVQYAAELSAQLGRTVEPGFEVFVAMANVHGKEEREWTYVRKDGTHFPVMLSVTPLRRPSGEVSGYLGLATDITERKQTQSVIERYQADLEARVRERTHELALANAQLQAEMAERDQLARQMRTMAHYDAITGLPNRNLLQDRLAQALLGAKRHQNLAAVMFLDLDRFKNINDTLGHAVGDALLEQVARRLSTAVRASDTLARIGGDEFVLLLPHVSGRDQAARVAEKLLSVLNTQLNVAGHSLEVSTSIGVCVFPDDGEQADVLLRNADTAMYQAKASGRNTYRFFTDRMNQEANQRYLIESSLRQGVREQELRLVYQPLVDTKTHQVFGVEVLVRWQSNALGLVGPAQFIAIAEETDLIVEIDSWVLKAACEQAARWRAEGRPPISLAVNLSARQFRRKDLVAFVAGVLADTGHPPHLLELEITESSLMHNVSDVIETLDQLVRLGVRLVIDDFGTGYSSLAYLKRFPVHKLKVDQSFVRDIGDTRHDLGILKTVIALAHTLQLDLLAEGVETHAQLDTLRALGCERFQGFLFARPLEAHDVAPLFERNVTQLISPALAA